MHQQVDGRPGQKPKENGDESAVAMLQHSRRLVCLFSLHRASEIQFDFTDGHKSLRPIRSMQLSKDTMRHVRSQESKRPSLGVVQHTSPHERSPYAPKFEEWSQEETERQERCARGDAWRMARSILELKQKDEATFFSPTQVWCLPAPSIIKQEERKICG